ncbi:MAG: hypothetical protein A2Z21_07210 [Candidatus Fraserbacteria bacterium RBG_16_55_9]|uniref:Uncharacterized protein n=1 Tax=Fraserbacteria sp. (strain RBG_16_55_9) TaxID=1817864 RepID=A0A1F5USN1_FRAXR|nr:MAG: hypothetical protein A2Z21_07210 [Candidatus Fraserbacteria bacterium RBG_16_55_9]
MITDWLNEWTFLGKPLSDYLTFLSIILGICTGYFGLILVITILLVLQNVGYNITTVLAGRGDKF